MPADRGGWRGGGDIVGGRRLLRRGLSGKLAVAMPMPVPWPARPLPPPLPGRLPALPRRSNSRRWSGEGGGERTVRWAMSLPCRRRTRF